MRRQLITVAAAAFLLAPAASAGLLSETPADDAGTTIRVADHMVEDLQRGDGSFPWVVGTDDTFQNVQGVTAQGLLDAYKLTGDEDYLDDGHNGGAAGTHTWLVNFIEENPDTVISAPNVYFLAEYGVLTQERHDIHVARDALDRDLAAFDDGNATNGSAAADLIRSIIQARADQGHTNLGLWDAALFIRAAQDVGRTDQADVMAKTLADQEIVDPFDFSNNWFEIGLAGLLFGLGEADVVAHQDRLDQARDTLVQTQDVCNLDGNPETNGSFPVTFGGETTCGGLTGVQVSSYAVLGLTFVGDELPAQQACDFIVRTQDAGQGGWIADDGNEIAEIDSEGVQALVHCNLPARNGATSYGDAAVGAAV